MIALYIALYLALYVISYYSIKAIVQSNDKRRNWHTGWNKSDRNHCAVMSIFLLFGIFVVFLIFNFSE